MQVALSGYLLIAFMACGVEDDHPSPKELAPDTWEYVASGPAVMAALPRSDSKDNLVENVEYSGLEREYYELVYGVSGSKPVALVLDKIGRRAFHLYVDSDRDRVINPGERVGDEGDTWDIAIDAAVSGEADPQRQVRIRRGFASLSVGTVGYCAGALTLGERSVDVRRIDANQDGLFASARDEMWCDFDANGEFDLIGERQPFRPVLQAFGKRWFLSAEKDGIEIATAELVGTARLGCDLSGIGTNLKNFELMIVGDDGSAISFIDADEQVSVPVGRYAVESFACDLVDRETGRQWSFVFSRYGKPRWYDLSKDDTLLLDPLGQLAFSVDYSVGPHGLRPGDTIRVTPRLRTESGLQINSCDRRDGRGSGSRFEIDQSQCARVFLQTVDPVPEFVSTYESGFR